jgi:starch phosphorylase
MVRSAADLMLPMVAVSLVSRSGYFRQEIDTQGLQVELEESWQPELWAQALDAKVAVTIEGKPVWVSAWLYVVEGHSGGRQPVLLLDTDLNENEPKERELTNHLYGGDSAYRLKQEIVLGVGGARLLQALGFDIFHYHMNEGHSALLGVELLRRYTYPAENIREGDSHYDIPRVRKMCSFTTHTPVYAGHDSFDYTLVSDILDGTIDLVLIKKFAGEDELNMTRLALNLSEYINGVAKSHADVSSKMFPGYKMHAITNGVHPYTWAAESFSKLYDAHIPGWCHEPELLTRAECCISDEDIWNAHQQAKIRLIEKVFALTGVRLNPNIPIIGFARRMTAYKRPDILFADIERLKNIANHQPFQIVMAGKAHPSDKEGKELIGELNQHLQKLVSIIPSAYLANYDLNIALDLISGSDIWLNTPLRPYEASGTSGMKAALNGVPSLSVLDGWWIEGCIEGVTGWAIGDKDTQNGGTSIALYDKFEQVVLPLYYQEDKSGWIKLMKSAISKNASYFNSHRMMRRYLIESYTR